MKIYSISVGSKNYKSIIKKKRKKLDEIVLPAKTKLNTAGITSTLIDSYIIHDEFVSVNNALIEYDDMKKSMKSLKTSTFHQRF